MQLLQKKFPNVKKFNLQNKRVDVFEKSLTEELEYSIDYLELGNKLIKKKGFKGRIGELFLWPYVILNLGLLIHTLITDPASNMIVFWVFGSGFFIGISLLAHFSVKTKVLFITGGQKSLELFQDKPDEVTVNEFLIALQQKIKESYIEEYLKFYDTTPVEYKKSQIEWLNRIDILTCDEAKTLLEECEAIKPLNIGFNQKNEKFD